MKLLSIGFLALIPPQDKPQDGEVKHDKTVSVTRAVTYLKNSQDPDGHWGNRYSCAITSMAGLALLASTDTPFEIPELLKATKWLMARIKAGRVPNQGHTWVHSQGFATLFLAEVYGRGLLSEAKPDLSLEKLRAMVTLMVKAIEAAQCDIGGWYYTPTKHNHEGSTTVCAVQALRSAANFGIEIDKRVLARGFEYLKKTQNDDGSFQYRLGDGSHMKEGTAGGVATLALMRKLDFPVLMKGGRHLVKIKAASITKGQFPFYGHFYSVLGMKLVADEIGAGVKGSKDWHKPVHKWLLEGQQKNGSWHLRRWMRQHGDERGKHDYSTALGALILCVHDERLSIFRHSPPVLPKAKRD